MSILAPLSVKDAIWIDVERGLRRKEEFDIERGKMEFINRRFDDLYLAILDVREVARHSDYFTQIAALKEAKHPKFTYYETENLPSVIAEKQRGKGESSNSTQVVEEKPRRHETPEERKARIRKEEEDEQSALVRRMWAHMKRVEAAEKQFGSAYDRAGEHQQDKAKQG